MPDVRWYELKSNLFYTPFLEQARTSSPAELESRLAACFEKPEYRLMKPITDKVLRSGLDNYLQSVDLLKDLSKAVLPLGPNSTVTTMAKSYLKLEDLLKRDYPEDLAHTGKVIRSMIENRVKHTVVSTTEFSLFIQSGLIDKKEAESLLKYIFEHKIRYLSVADTPTQLRPKMYYRQALAFLKEQGMDRLLHHPEYKNI
ncbi:MAG: hypothetical protein V1837_06075 [Candidatus Woesearchaeota archaeon]